MKRMIVAILIVLVLPNPAFGLAYDTASYTNDDVLVTVDLEANAQWSAPFTEVVNISLSVVPVASSIQEVNITSVTVIVNSEEADETDYLLIAAEEKIGSPLATGNSFANYSAEFALSGTSHGLECYFAILVSGSWTNGTHQEFFQSLSPDDFIGPFAVSASLESPIVYVGILVLAIATVIFIAGVFGVKRSRKRSRRRSLED